MTKNNDTILDPALLDALKKLRQDVARSLNCIKVGRIQKFDGSKKTAEVQILLKRVLPDGSILSYPLLVDCPVFTLQGGGASLRMPIVPGDQCLVLFSDRNLDAWFKTGTEAAPFDNRCHDLSDGIVLVGLNALTSNLADYEEGVAVLEFDGARLGMEDGKVIFENNTISLLAAIELLIDVLKTLTDAASVPLSPASIAALEAQKLVFQGLLNP